MPHPSPKRTRVENLLTLGLIICAMLGVGYALYCVITLKHLRDTNPEALLASPLTGHIAGTATFLGLLAIFGLALPFFRK